MNKHEIDRLFISQESLVVCMFLFLKLWVCLCFDTGMFYYFTLFLISPVFPPDFPFLFLLSSFSSSSDEEEEDSDEDDEEDDGDFLRRLLNFFDFFGFFGFSSGYILFFLSSSWTARSLKFITKIPKARRRLPIPLWPVEDGNLDCKSLILSLSMMFWFCLCFFLFVCLVLFLFFCCVMHLFMFTMFISYVMCCC